MEPIDPKSITPRARDVAAKSAAAIIAALPGVLTYSEVAEQVNTSKRLLGVPLDLIARVCMARGWPHLTLMVCTHGTKDDIVPMPGNAAFDPKTDRMLTLDVPRYEIGGWQARIRAFDWSTALPVLADAATYEELITGPAEASPAITRRVPEGLVPQLDELLAVLKPMKPAVRDGLMANLIATAKAAA